MRAHTISVIVGQMEATMELVTWCTWGDDLPVAEAVMVFLTRAALQPNLAQTLPEILAGARLMAGETLIVNREYTSNGRDYSFKAKEDITSEKVAYVLEFLVAGGYVVEVSLALPPERDERSRGLWAYHVCSYLGKRLIAARSHNEWGDLAVNVRTVIAYMKVRARSQRSSKTILDIAQGSRAWASAHQVMGVHHTFWASSSAVEAGVAVIIRKLVHDGVLKKCRTDGKQDQYHYIVKAGKPSIKVTFALSCDEQPEARATDFRRVLAVDLTPGAGTAPVIDDDWAEESALSPSNYPVPDIAETPPKSECSNDEDLHKSMSPEDAMNYGIAILKRRQENPDEESYHKDKGQVMRIFKTLWCKQGDESHEDDFIEQVLDKFFEGQRTLDSLLELSSKCDSKDQFILVTSLLRELCHS